jgi:hypothetical protein
LGSFGIFGERATRDDRDCSESDVASRPSSFRHGQWAGMRGSDVMGNIGEMRCQRDVNGGMAACQNFARDASAAKEAAPNGSTEYPKPV